jgi:glutamyl-tRNA synthetase
MARLGSSEPVVMCGSVEEIVAGFRIGSFGASPTKFDAADLWPLTARALAEKPLSAVQGHLARAGVPAALAGAFWEAVRGNLVRIDDVAEWWRVLAEGGAAAVAPEDRDFAEAALALLPEPPYDAGTWAAWTAAVSAATGRKGRGLFLPLRRIVTGRDAGPDMAALMPLVQVRPRLR